MSILTTFNEKLMQYPENLLLLKVRLFHFI